MQNSVKTPTCFAAGVTTIVDAPVDAFALASWRAEVADLVALSERYGLSPEETAAALGSAGIEGTSALEVLVTRCDGDPELATALVDAHIAAPLTAVVADVVRSIDLSDDDSLIAALGPPDSTAASGLDWNSLDAALQAACEPAGIEVDL